jgi:hypothetical protein
MTTRTSLTSEERAELTQKIRILPSQVAAFVQELTADQLVAQPIDREWSIAQNVHHLADSHLNSFVRLKLILTEDHPTLKPYDQDAWADLPDSNNSDLSTSLALLRGLHARWVLLFENLSQAQWARTGFHPDAGDVTPVDLLRTYADHGEGHLDQMARALAALG